MSQKQTRIEWCGNIQVHHPVKPIPNLADIKGMLAEVGVTVEVLSAEELAHELAFGPANDGDRP